MKERRFLMAFLATLWLVFVAMGMIGLKVYSDTPGDVSSVPADWPRQSQLQRSSDPTLLVFFHPECACSQATADELDQALAKAAGPVQTIAVFIRPSGWTDEDLKGKLWKRIRLIPGTSIYIDNESREAQLFGAATSGHTVLYSPDGKLVFTGGITGSRGHRGDNLGKSSLIAALNSQRLVSAKIPVFGCELAEATP